MSAASDERMGSDRSTPRVTANTHTPRIKSTFTANIFVANVDISFTPFSSGGRRDESPSGAL